jgi:hypothetical protein
MNYYDLEMQMWDRQRDLLHNAEMRRLAAGAGERHEGHAANGARHAWMTAIVGAVRAMVAPGRSARVERPGLGDAS